MLSFHRYFAPCKDTYSILRNTDTHSHFFLPTQTVFTSHIQIILFTNCPDVSRVISSALCTVLLLSPWAFQECTEWNAAIDGMIYMRLFIKQLYALPNIIQETKSWVERKSSKQYLCRQVLYKQAIEYTKQTHIQHQRLIVFFVIGGSIRSLLVSFHPWGTFPQTGLTLSVDPPFLLLPTPSLPLSLSVFPTLSPLVSPYLYLSSPFPPLCLTHLFFLHFPPCSLSHPFFSQVLNVIVALVKYCYKSAHFWGESYICHM